MVESPPASSSASAEGAERLEGAVEHVVYQNPENGYAVVRLSVPSLAEHVTAAGILGDLHEGIEVVVWGRFTEHRRYGRQFQIEDAQVSAPTTAEGIVRHLSSGSIPGLGEKLAWRIWEAFGEETLDILDNHSRRLLEVEGIGKKKLLKIVEAWQEQRGRREALIYLQGLGLGPGLAGRIAAQWRGATVQRVDVNPYCLTEFHGIGFRRADAIAARLDITGADPRRLEAGIVFTLATSNDDGHTCLPREELIDTACRMLGADEVEVVAALERLIASHLLVDEAVDLDPDRHVFIPTFHEHELQVARMLAEMAEVEGAGAASASPVDPYPHLDAASLGAVLPQDALAAGIGVALDPDQERAVKVALSHQLTVITGGPGVGKTTVVRAIVSAAETAEWSVKLAAPTGRAAKRMEEATGHRASTIHRLLRWDPMKGGFEHGLDRPLKADLVVIDETSMVDVQLMRQLLEALALGTRLVLVGDADQLPSVGPGEVLRDVIASEAAHVVRLQRIFRQASGGLIVANAHRIDAGEMPILPEPGEESDFYFVEEDDPVRARERILKLVAERLPRAFDYDPMEDIQVLSPMYRGACGNDALNLHLGRLLNPPPDREPVVGREAPAAGAPALDAPPDGDSEQAQAPRLRAGDKIMQTANDYERDVFNGDLGRLLSIDSGGDAVARFGGREVELDFEALRNIVPAYSISIHKSQGAEYPAVIVPILGEHFIMLRRRLLYTAATRARKLLILIGSRRALARAVSTDEGVRGRHTRLVARIREQLANVVERTT